MEQKWKHVLLLLVFHQQLTSADHRQLGPLKEGAEVDIECQPNRTGSLTTWFRALDHGGVEFIAAFANEVKKDTEGRPSSSFSYKKIKSHKVTLGAFRRERDSGLYGCSALVKGKELSFGPLTRLFGEPVKQKPTVAPTTPRHQPVTSAPACACDSAKNVGEVGPSLSCTPLILGPLAGGCGLLLLLLIVTTLYCNRIRTRRCPHHYKRQPRLKPPGK